VLLEAFPVFIDVGMRIREFLADSLIYRPKVCMLAQANLATVDEHCFV
jgi:hypothetical protein